MKTSLLLTSLVMSLAVAGTAQAGVVATRAPRPGVETQTLAATSASSNGVLSVLSDLLSARTHAGDHGNSDAQTSDNHAHAAHPENRHQPPGPPMLPGVDPHRHAASTSGRAHPPAAATSVDGDPSAAAGAALGWQSLLPGSIQ